MKWIYSKNPHISKICVKSAYPKKNVDPIQNRISARCTLLEVAYVEVLLYIMGPHKNWTNCIKVQCIAARIRMISPLGKSTFTPIAYQSRLQWLKGDGSSISNCVVFLENLNFIHINRINHDQNLNLILHTLLKKKVLY